MSRRNRIHPSRNFLRPAFDQLDARLLLSATVAGSGANGAGTTWSNEPDVTTYQKTTTKKVDAWSGYAITSKSSLVTGVGATWVQPTMSSTGKHSTASFWVGIDGWGNGTVEQIGTSWGPRSGYTAWVEFYGDGIKNTNGGGSTNGDASTSAHKKWAAIGKYFNEVSINHIIGSHYFSIEPGDVISASVNYVSSTSTTSTFEFHFQDARPGGPTEVWRDDLTTQYVVPKRTTAEWIVESPNGARAPLAQFSTVNFSGAWLSTGGSPQPITAYPNDQLNLVPSKKGGGTDSTSGLTTSNTPGAWQFTGQSSAFDVVFGSAHDNPSVRSRSRRR
jgi:hypothetical protein